MAYKLTLFVILIIGPPLLFLLDHKWKMLEIVLDFWFLHCAANETF